MFRHRLIFRHEKLTAVITIIQLYTFINTLNGIQERKKANAFIFVITSVFGINYDTQKSSQLLTTGLLAMA